MAIDYQVLIDKAMLSVVKAVLTEVQDKGLGDDQNFYISYRTNFKGVILSPHVKQRYPKEITIVLQHQFKNLRVFEDKFVVNIAFNGAAENIEVPFASIVSFLDPIANFGFQFITEKSEPAPAVHIKKAEILSIEPKFTPKKESKNTKVGSVIAIDKFRKKREEENDIS